MNPLFHTEFSISDSLKNVRKSVLIYETIIGHWIGVFIDKGNETQIDFTENVIPKKWFMKPFVKTYLKKQQKQFVLDLKKALE